MGSQEFEISHKNLLQKNLPVLKVLVKAGFLKMLLLKLLLLTSCVSTNFDTVDDAITITNEYIEVSLSRLNGAMLSLTDKTSDSLVIEADGSLPSWTATFDDGAQLNSNSNGLAFTYKWYPEENKLVLNYLGEVDVEVNISILDDNELEFQANVFNNKNTPLSSFEFPSGFSLKKESIKDGLIPLMPGVILSNDFFSQQKSYIATYPGELFADFIAMRTPYSSITIYSVENSPLNPVQLGFESKAQIISTQMVRKWVCWIGPEKSWSSPKIVVNIGDDYPETIKDYRVRNGINLFPDIKEKTGEKWEQFSRSPLYKLDFEQEGKTFAQISDYVIDQSHLSGILHLVAFQVDGHDRNYPTFIPPDDAWGSIQDMIDLVQKAQNRGFLVVPYTNFSWWNNDGHVLSNLPENLTLNDIAVMRSNGIPLIERYTGSTGIVMNLHHPFVRSIIEIQHDLILNTLGADGVLEDQWGARNSMLDFNEHSLTNFEPHVSYFEGILNHSATHSTNMLMTEQGVDVLAKYLVAFMGTNLLWDKIGYRNQTAPFSQYYPMAGMMLRDKVMLFQHNLAIETFTTNKDMLRWNFTHGYSLSGYLTENPWDDLIGIFQKYVISRYKDQLVSEFNEIESEIFKTSFADHIVYSNWHSTHSFMFRNSVVPPGGFVVSSEDNGIFAGIFSVYNGIALSPGEHYIVEKRTSDNIKLFHPEGHDTEITIKIPDNWDNVTVQAISDEETILFENEVLRKEGNYVTFRAFGRLLLPQLYFYLISPDN